MSVLLERLRRSVDDRGMLAGLRCGLVESKKHRAWPYLARLGVNLGGSHAEETTILAGLFAMHSQEASSGNIGTTCKQIERERCKGEKQDKDGKLSPTERRFLHLLSSEKGTELHDRVVRIVLAAKAQSIPINFEQLGKDLRYWGERTRSEWAAEFWATGRQPSENDREVT